METNAGITERRADYQVPMSLRYSMLKDFREKKGKLF
jgi:hypothetical protein